MPECGLTARTVRLNEDDSDKQGGDCSSLKCDLIVLLDKENKISDDKSLKRKKRLNQRGFCQLKCFAAEY